MSRMKPFPMLIVVPALIMAVGVAARPDTTPVFKCDSEDDRSRGPAVETPATAMGCISGTVEDADGNPMAGVVVQATWQGGQQQDRAYDDQQRDDQQQQDGQRRGDQQGVTGQWQSSATSDTTDADGKFRILNLRPGNYRVSLERHQADPQTVEVKDGEETDGVDFEVRSMTGSR